MTPGLFRLGAGLAVLILLAAILDQYAGTLLLACLAVMAWRLWTVARRGRWTPPALPAGAGDPAEPFAPPVARRARSGGDPLAELDAMVGLSAAKAEIRRLADLVAAERERRRTARLLGTLAPDAEPPALHLLFLGNPAP